MEYTITERYDREANLLRKHLILGCLGRKVDVDVYKSMDNTFTRIHVSDHNISRFESKNIQFILKYVKESHRFLTTDKQHAIIHLMKLNPHYNSIKNMWNVFYYDVNDMTLELQEFAHIFVSQINNNIISVPFSKNEATEVLGLRSVGLLDSTIENTNGRLYLTTGDETHHMSYTDTVNTIVADQKNPMYHIQTKYDKINIMRIQLGVSPIKLFEHFDAVERCRLMIGFTDMCMSNNLPVRDDITNFMYKEQGYLYYTRLFERKLLEEADSVTIAHFKKEEFDDIEAALAFIIYLSDNYQNYILLYGKRYTVCYNSQVSYPKVHLPSLMKRHLPHFLRCTPTDDNLDIIDGSSLVDLFKYKVVRGNILNNNYVHVDPRDNSPLPLDYYSFDGARLRCISGLSKPMKPFDRTHLDIPPVVISFSGQHLVFGDTMVESSKFPMDTRDTVSRYATALWKKGYFITTYGLMYYIETEVLLEHCISLPVWFTVDGSNIHNLEAFIRFNFSEYLEDS